MSGLKIGDDCDKTVSAPKQLHSDFAVLSNGVKMPSFGLGTFEMKDPDDLRIAISSAIAAGYRGIDTAQCYRNEGTIGSFLWKVVADAGLSREDIFITSKLHPSCSGFEKVLNSIKESLRLLSVSYIDLFLIHWPGTAKIRSDSAKNQVNRRESWLALQEAYKMGLVRAIGVSNFTTAHLEQMKREMLSDNSTILKAPLQHCPTLVADMSPNKVWVLPMVNQIEIHPMYHPIEDIAWCRQNGVYVQAYSSLGRSQILNPAHPIYAKFPFLIAIMEDKLLYLQGIVDKTSKDMKSNLNRAIETENTSIHAAESIEPSIDALTDTDSSLMAHIFLRWGLQHVYGLIPKSKNPDRIKKNIEMLHRFTLNDSEMELLDSIHRQISGSELDGIYDTCGEKICWDPRDIA